MAFARECFRRPAPKIVVETTVKFDDAPRSAARAGNHHPG